LLSICRIQTKYNCQLSDEGDDTKVNAAEAASTQKYSQILGDHHANGSVGHSTNNKAPSNHHNHTRSRAYNKENYYNQRSVGGKFGGSQRSSWQRNATSFRAPTVNGKDKGKPEESTTAGSSETTLSAEPKKFNEGKLS